jgi:hypothetical protein
MVNYTVYQNWFDAYHQNKLTQPEFQNINSFLQELDDEKTAERLEKELEDMEKQCPLPQMSKMVTEKYKSLLREKILIGRRSLDFEYSTEVKPEFKDIFIPIKSAEKLPIRSELYTKEFKCLTHSRINAKDDWNIQYLSGSYHDKTKRLFVETLGDSYEMNTLQFNFSFRRYFAKKRKSSKSK